MTFWLLILFAYMVGSIPFGLLFGRLFADVDVREFGSGNIGATNVNRVLGRKLGAATLLSDALKGLLCVILARILLEGNLVQPAWVGCSAFIGHCFSLYLRFRGGKGVATAFGVLFAISVLSGLVGLATWVVVVKTSRISALGALVSSLVIPLAVYFFERSLPLTLIFALMMTILVIRHRENIKRIRSGNEKSA